MMYISFCTLCFKIEGHHYFNQYTIIQSFGLCLQINCLQGPRIFNVFFFITAGTQWFWTGTRDFSQDESQDSPLSYLYQNHCM